MMSDQTTTQKENTPVAEIHQLDWFIGEWQVKSRIKTQEGWAEDELESTIEPMLDGHALLEKFWGTLDGDPINAMSMRVYCPQNKRWEQAWLDTSGKTIGVFYGEYKDGQFIGRNQKSVLDPQSERYGREIFSNITENTFDWRYEASKDQGQSWTVIWELVYTRK